MNHKTHFQMLNTVALIDFQQGRVNSLSLALRQRLQQALTAALADDAVTAIVLYGRGGVFSAGADVTEFNTPAASAEPSLVSVLALVAQSQKPIVAAIEGVAYGGGLELALAASHRLLSPTVQLALPEVSLGLVPGAGGTQRLPRLVGLAHALDLISSGRSIGAEEALRIGLAEAVMDVGLAEGACLYATKVVADFVPLSLDAPPLVGADDAEALVSQAYADVAKRKRGFKAPKVAIDCVAASLRLPLNEGLAFERARFESLLLGPETQALRHLFFAQRLAAKTVMATSLPPIEAVGVVGGGLMGRGISINCADAGLSVCLLEQNEAALAKALEHIKQHYQGLEAKGRLTTVQCAERLALIRGSVHIEALADMDLVIEAIFEDMAAKQALLRQLDAVCGPKTLLASNTSRLNIDALAGSTTRPQQVLGLHFFSPANLMRLLEVVRGEQTAPMVVARAMALAKRLQKIAVVVGVCEGFVGNRMLAPYQQEALFLLEEGATVTEVDQALFEFGMAMGPFVMSDMAGLDIGWAARKRLASSRDPAKRYSDIADRLCLLGRFGQKTGAGFYRYEGGSRTPLPDAEVTAVIQAAASAVGRSPESMDAAEAVARTVYALINEGAKILAEGIVAHASDIDLVYVHGYGFPAYRGGPLFYADSIGLDKVLAQMQQWQQRHGEVWRPAALIEALVASGQGFYGPLV
ncbi:MAG: enoyl-CoA hydratase/isomerase family protein [Neisseriaceae bacterium]|nr:enoyl-CoA hydratase/isomerase family protein [Neisseriaceae bacterium]